MAKLYLCDPDKNTTCKKTLCQKECKMTDDIKYAKILVDPHDGQRVIISNTINHFGVDFTELEKVDE